MIRQIFVNLPVKDLKKSREFFTKLGFTFNPKLTDENATCMILGEHMYAMLLEETYFKTFAPKEICAANKSTGVLVSLAVESREKVDELVDKVQASGGRDTSRSHAHGWMYGRSFEDIDGHSWEIFYMDESRL